MNALEKLQSYNQPKIVKKLLEETKPSLEFLLKGFRKQNDEMGMFFAEITETVIQLKKDQTKMRKMFTRIQNRELNK
jgi:hypothetical protein|tara:strand:+ start:355 stop:585 length:231 start_codon:yes stop_codon:yes gene_type:complete